MPDVAAIRNISDIFGDSRKQQKSGYSKKYPKNVQRIQKRQGNDKKTKLSYILKQFICNTRPHAA